MAEYNKDCNCLDMEWQDFPLGTDVKTNIWMEPTDNAHLSNVDWEVEVISQRKIVIRKDEALKCVDDNNYLINIPTDKVGRGKVWLKLKVKLPDADYANGYRREPILFPSGINVI